MNAPLTANDFYFAILTSKGGKAPDPDGLSIEYYKVAIHAWARFSNLVIASLPANYRPLTLLKLGPKILAYRLRLVLSAIIPEDQSGFIQGRSIRHSLLRFQDLQGFLQGTSYRWLRGDVRFAKAFDSVLWPALNLVLHHFGFESTFRAWIKTFYHQTSVTIMLNGSPGDPFVLSAGVRQGGPLSPGLFVHFVEPMMSFLRARFSDRGISVDGSSAPHLLMALADDCTGLLKPIDDAPGFLRLVNDYSSAVGLRLNVSKTSAMSFSHQISRSKLADLRAISPFKILGVTDTVKLLDILQSATITPDTRFRHIILQFRTRCDLWKFWARTLRGKVGLLQSIILPLLWYTASVTNFTASMLKAVGVIIRNFVNGKDTASESASPGKFDNDWIYTSINHGGLGLTPVKKFIQAMHLKSLCDAISATCTHCAAPRWMTPALSLFSIALSSQGTGFDVLYAVVKGTWIHLPDF
ncbi:unnamed protein product [Peronospora destructor]|uniref:Reverse transcriptase domain-containing protein n=1 Tax=Peronospora destructor TaxID=86335 RepID=A0AAV0TBH4_9STRA|nr:unnamed protein product [Peronospora destructor]